MATFCDVDYLPVNVLTLSGYDFYQFSKTTLGEPEANLLKKYLLKQQRRYYLLKIHLIFLIVISKMKN